MMQTENEVQATCSSWDEGAFGTIDGIEVLYSPPLVNEGGGPLPPYVLADRAAGYVGYVLEWRDFLGGRVALEEGAER